MIKFLKYLFRYKANTHKLVRLEEELAYYKTALELEEKKANDKNNALRQIENLFVEDEKYGAIKSKLYNEIRTVVRDNLEKKLSDEIFPHYYSPNSLLKG